MRRSAAPSRQAAISAGTIRGCPKVAAAIDLLPQGKADEDSGQEWHWRGDLPPGGRHDRFGLCRVFVDLGGPCGHYASSGGGCRNACQPLSFKRTQQPFACISSISFGQAHPTGPRPRDGSSPLGFATFGHSGARCFGAHGGSNTDPLCRAKQADVPARFRATRRDRAGWRVVSGLHEHSRPLRDRSHRYQGRLPPTLVRHKRRRLSGIGARRSMELRQRAANTKGCAPMTV